MSESSGAGDNAVDMSQFYGVFFDETAENLAAMERLLVEFNPAVPDDEGLNAIFRAAHSIKGGSATFGFADMTEVTHELESLLDKVRRHEVTMTPQMVDALLAAGDVLRAQLARHRGDTTNAAPAAAAICARIRAFVGGAAAPAMEQVRLHRFMIRFALPDAMPVPANLLAELGDAGCVESQDTTGGRCTLVLRTSAGARELREIFAFFVDPDTVDISAAEAADAEPANTGEMPSAARADAAPAIGRRAIDSPAVHSAIAGRRNSDKVVVVPLGEPLSIRVHVEKVDQLIDLVGELVIAQSMLAQSAAHATPAVYEKLQAGIGQVERSTRNLQEAVLSIRMLPISLVFSRFPRMVRDLAARLGKEVELKTVGESTELDKGLIEKIADPLTQLVRNSLDHGIEAPAQRRAAGKPATGSITLRAWHQGGNVIIEVSDDGGGLNREKILAAARQRGMAVAPAMSDREVWELIFEAGFSTADAVTDVSGRGVGMDVVRRNIQALGGRIEIESTAGSGTRIAVRLPLTLAIVDGISVRVGAEFFIVPLTNILESLRPTAADVKTIAGRGRLVRVRGEYVPVVALHELFNIHPHTTEVHEGIAVILDTEGHRTALLVDSLAGQHQVVIKGLESNYRRVPGVSGATIMGNGKVALILDAVALGRAASPALAEAA